MTDNIKDTNEIPEAPISNAETLRATLQEHIQTKKDLTRDLFHLENALVNILNLVPSTSKGDSDIDAQLLSDTLESVEFDETMEKLFLLTQEIDADKDARKARISNLQALNSAGDRKIEALEKVAKALMFMAGRKVAGGLEAQRLIKDKPDVYDLVDPKLVPDDYMKTPEPTVMRAELKKAIKAGIVTAEDVGIVIKSGGTTLAKMPISKK